MGFESLIIRMSNRGKIIAIIVIVIVVGCNIALVAIAVVIIVGSNVIIIYTLRITGIIVIKELNTIRIHDWRVPD